MKTLKSNALGDQAENDFSTETDLHYVVLKDYKHALSSIISVTETFDVKKKVTVYLRDYKSFDKWVDKVIYPE